MPKIYLKDRRPDHEKPKPLRMVDRNGRKLDALPIQLPQDHRQVQRFGLGHQYAKGFYFSTSTGSINTKNPLRLGEFFVINDGTKQSAVARTVVERWTLQPDTDNE